MNAIIESLETQFGKGITNNLIHSQNKYVLQFMTNLGSNMTGDEEILSDYQNQLVTSNPFVSDIEEVGTLQEVSEACDLLTKVYTDASEQIVRDLLSIISLTAIVTEKANKAYSVSELEISDQSKMKLLELDADKIKSCNDELKKISMPHGLKGKFRSILYRIECIEYSFRRGSISSIQENDEIFLSELEDIFAEIENKIDGDQ
ncbi:hypothetical protein [Shouchella miscanthi]|uniref:Uncharacterized protein n=1 Tax=Shouchella miscanthi TaxID=2598861 RepID=A0ABU6NJS6_9BACI|nr:hypothetical protein [Shouchella miscanthi]